jgi:hypothetical protein
MENRGKTYVCFCGKRFEKKNFPSHAQLCPVYQTKKEELRPQVIKLKSEGMTREEIAKNLTASLPAELRDKGVIVSVNFIKKLLSKPKQGKETTAAKKTEQRRTLGEWVEVLRKDPTLVGDLINAGFFNEAEPMNSIIICLLARYISLTGENQSLEIEIKNLLEKNQLLSRGMTVLTSQLNTQKREENAALIKKCSGAMVVHSGGGNLARDKD